MDTSRLDDDKFIEAVDVLLAGFQEWAGPRLAADDDGQTVSGVDTLLGWRHYYSDGQLMQLSVADVEEYLLRWCPRTLSYPPEEWPGVLSAATLWVEYLQATNQWTGGLATRVTTRLSSIEAEFIEAMGDPTNFGMSKSMFMGPALSGADIDLSDPESFQGAMDAFNELPFEMRKELTDPGIANMMAPPPAVEMFGPPMPDPTSVVEAAKNSPILRSVEAVIDYLGPKGKPLTARGYPKLADVRALVRLFEVEGVTEEEREQRIEKLRSAGDLPQFHYMIEACVMARALETTGKVLRPGRSWSSLSPVEQVGELFDALMDIGPIHSRVDLAGEKEDLVEGGVGHWLAPAMVGAVVDIDEIVAEGVSIVEEMFETGAFSSSIAPFWCETLVSYLLDPIERCGLVDRVGTRIEEHRAKDGAIKAGGLVSVTPLGRVVMNDFVEMHGYDFVSIDSFSDADGITILNVAASSPIDEFDSLWETWLPDEDAGTKSALLVEAIALATGPAERAAGFTFLRRAGSSAEAAVKPLLDGPLRDYAIGLMIEVGSMSVEDAILVHGHKPNAPMIDVLAITLDGPPDEATAFWASLKERIDDMPALIDELWRVQLPETAEVLEAFSRIEPDKTLSKALRKAAFKRRSAST